MAMSNFLQQMGQVVTECVTWMNLFLNAILDSPALITICIAVPLVNVAVNLLRRLIRL